MLATGSGTMLLFHARLLMRGLGRRSKRIFFRIMARISNETLVGRETDVEGGHGERVVYASPSNVPLRERLSLGPAVSAYPLLSALLLSTTHPSPLLSFPLLSSPLSSAVFFSLSYFSSRISSSPLIPIFLHLLSPPHSYLLVSHLPSSFLSSRISSASLSISASRVAYKPLKLRTWTASRAVYLMALHCPPPHHLSVESHQSVSSVFM